jgi:hypothetical protein
LFRGFPTNAELPSRKALKSSFIILTRRCRKLLLLFFQIFIAKISPVSRNKQREQQEPWQIRQVVKKKTISKKDKKMSRLSLITPIFETLRTQAVSLSLSLSIFLSV